MGKVGDRYNQSTCWFLVKTTLSLTRTITTRDKGQAVEPPILGKKQTVNSFDIEELANRAAWSTVEGFVQQDKRDFDASSLQFSIMLQTMFPEYDSDRLLKAAQAYVSALLVQSKLKDEHSDPFDRLHDERWEYVRSELVRMAKLLDMPSSFGVETGEVWRYHSAQDDSFVKHIIEFNRALVRRLTGDEKYFKVLAGLYAAGLALHDAHNAYSVMMGREVMKLYYRILFQVMNGEDKLWIRPQSQI